VCVCVCVCVCVFVCGHISKCRFHVRNISLFFAKLYMHFMPLEATQTELIKVPQSVIAVRV